MIREGSNVCVKHIYYHCNFMFALQFNLIIQRQSYCIILPA